MRVLGEILSGILLASLLRNDARSHGKLRQFYNFAAILRIFPAISLGQALSFEGQNAEARFFRALARKMPAGSV